MFLKGWFVLLQSNISLLRSNISWSICVYVCVCVCVCMRNCGTVDAFVLYMYVSTQRHTQRHTYIHTHTHTRTHTDTHTYTHTYTPLSFSFWISLANTPLWERPSGWVTRISTSPHVGFPRRYEPQVTTCKPLLILWLVSRTYTQISFIQYDNNDMTHRPIPMLIDFPQGWIVSEFLIRFEAWAELAQEWLVCVPLGILEPINKELMLLVTILTAPSSQKRELCCAK